MRRALFSVTDKSGLDLFAKELKQLFPNLEILASGGTAKFLDEKGISHTPIEKVTQFPECFGGRVKTLHPSLLGGILYRRGIDDLEAEKLNITPIDLVVCNLYKFENLPETIDIGGSTMIRAAVKNFQSVLVLIDPEDYAAATEAIKDGLTLEIRKMYAAKAMHFSAKYERMIAGSFVEKKLSYGENPDQEGWIFAHEKGIATAKTYGTKPLSYNNYEDASLAFYAIQRICHLGPSVAILKHGGLCGYATGKNLIAAFEKAWAGDPKSAFGSVIAFSGEVGMEIAEHLKGRFIEVILAPKFSVEFLQWTAVEKPSLRLIEMDLNATPKKLYRGISGGMLVQTPKQIRFSALSCNVVTKRLPNPEQYGLFSFAIAAVFSVKSNAIILAHEYEPSCYHVIGIGGGQPNRIDSLERLALPKGKENLPTLKDVVLASDGFFPFADSIKVAADAGIEYFIQPGGYIRDKEVIEEADKRGLSMIFTGERYFSH
jgi:phosphoribosylaminoimidazolecarboxamide formyltransferase/IMP cyclohydrolase